MAVTLASLAVHAGAFGLAVRIARPSPAPPPAVLAGERFTAPEMVEDTPPAPVTTTSVPAPAGQPPPSTEAPLAARPQAPASATRPASGEAPGTTGTAVAPEQDRQFGALGDRSAVDITLAFTRAFPQAASTDPAWVAAPLGDAGTVDVTLTIDDTGRLTESSADGGTPPLRDGVSRTLALIRGRVFVARAATTRLRVHATVSADEVHDGLHGDVFALGASVADKGAREGNAFFALAIGRRVDLRILLR
jgi:hypothetical protein